MMESFKRLLRLEKKPTSEQTCPEEIEIVYNKEMSEWQSPLYTFYSIGPTFRSAIDMIISFAKDTILSHFGVNSKPLRDNPINEPVKVAH